MIGEDWKCYDSLRHFELNSARYLNQNVFCKITENLGKTKQLN